MEEVEVDMEVGWEEEEASDMEVAWEEEEEEASDMEASGDLEDALDDLGASPPVPIARTVTTLEGGPWTGGVPTRATTPGRPISRATTGQEPCCPGLWTTSMWWDGPTTSRCTPYAPTPRSAASAPGTTTLLCYPDSLLE